MTGMKSIFFTLVLTVLNVSLATGQEIARHSLEETHSLLDSPRHQEWVRVRHGDREVVAFLVYPEVDHKAKSVIVIHENRGLNDWVRTVADRLAEAGYIAIAPDLLSGMGPGGGRTSDFADSDAAREGIYKLDPTQVTADLTAVVDFVRMLPAANGVVAVAGFCWGGAQTFRFATNEDDLDAAFVFYGTAPADSAGLARISAPVYGFYGGNDARVNATIEPTQRLLDKMAKTYEPVVYEGAGHGFMRRGEAGDASDADRMAMQTAWERWLTLLAGGS